MLEETKGQLNVLKSEKTDLSATFLDLLDISLALLLLRGIHFLDDRGLGDPPTARKSSVQIFEISERKIQNTSKVSKYS